MEAEAPNRTVEAIHRIEEPVIRTPAPPCAPEDGEPCLGMNLGTSDETRDLPFASRKTSKSNFTCGTIPCT